MGVKADFYIACTKRAWERSIDLANSWGSILGAAILAVVLALIGKPFKMPETISGAIAFSLMCLGAAWAVIFLGRAVHAAGELFVAQHRDLATAQGQLIPKIKTSFGKDIPGCVRPNTTLSVAVLDYFTGKPTGRHKSDTGTYYRIRVEAAGVGAIHCTASIPWIKRNGRDWFDGENLLMTFAPSERPNAETKEVRPGVPEYVDVLFVANDFVLPTTKGFIGPSSVDFENMFANPGEYVFHLVLTSPTSSPVGHEIKLIWKGTAEASQVIDIGQVPA
jgi:hypothetical protein